MKDHDIDTHNLTDFYISTNLKNWAACQRPPAGGRRRLLKAASKPIYEKREPSFTIAWLQRIFTYRDDHPWNRKEVAFVPFSQTTFWTFHRNGVLHHVT